MALITRLSRLFEADFHAVLDRIEEPDLQLKQAVREMQFALDQDRQSLKLLQHEIRQLDKNLAETGSAITGFDEELDICLAAKKDDLARDLVRRKLAAEKKRQAVAERSENLEVQRQGLAREIDENEQQLSAMKQKLALLVSDQQQFDPVAAGQADTVRDEEIEIALLREKQRRAKS